MKITLQWNVKAKIIKRNVILTLMTKKEVNLLINIVESGIQHHKLKPKTY
jgi:hypothetical protein